MSLTTEGRTVPRAHIHKRVLDAAAAKPDASMEALAEEVPSATTELVERILEQYGDPIEGDSVNPLENGSEKQDPQPPLPDREDLPQKQEDVLGLIHETPEATQEALAERLDVSPATVSKRANSIDGFQWKTRHTFTPSNLCH